MNMYTCIIFVLFSYFFVLTDTTKDYGLYTASLKRFELCKGPKIKDCTVGSANITSHSILSLELAVIESTVLEKGKVTIYSLENNQTLRMQLKKPCDNLFQKSIFQALFNASDRCIIPKGVYKMNVNYDDLFHKYYGKMYLYGTHIYKAVYYGKDCNFICSTSEVVLSPRK